MEINIKKKGTWFLILTIFLVTIAALVVYHLMTKQVQVDAATGDEIPGGLVTKNKFKKPSGLPAVTTVTK